MPDECLIQVNNTDGLQVYQSEIDLLCADYIATLDDPKQVYNSITFIGLLQYIYRHKIKHIIETDKHNRNTNTNNYILLDEIFNNIYLPLNTKYKIVPSLLGFCTFVKISKSNIYDILAGVYHVDRATVNSATSAIIKTWNEICENSLYNKAAVDNGVGSIFLLKSVYSYQEAAQRVEISQQEQSAPAEQIAEKYANTAAPILPDKISDNENSTKSELLNNYSEQKPEKISREAETATENSEIIL